MLSDFFQVLSDGYNPATLDLKIITGRPYTEEMIFEYNSKYAGGGDSGRQILKTKSDVSDVAAYLTSKFQQSLDHLASLTVAPDIFKSQFHLENLKKIISDLVDRILLYIRSFVWECQAFSYKLSYEEELVMLYSSSQIILIQFGNHIH